MKTLSIGYSPCPNDTFIFYAMIHGKVESRGMIFDEVLLDVETLNRKALKAELDITKVSYHAFGHLRDTYCLLRAGGALGRGCGPLLIAGKECSMEELRKKKIAIPGKLTTAYLLLQLYDPRFHIQHSAVGKQLPEITEMPFHEIIRSIADGTVDAGLIIHESRFTYPSYGLKKIIDLGDWWEKETGLPIPLGGIIAKESHGHAQNRRINEALRESVEFALSNPGEPMNYIKEHSQELSDDVIQQHVDLYVNDFSIELGKEGEKALRELLSRAEEAGIIPKSKKTVIV